MVIGRSDNSHKPVKGPDSRPLVSSDEPMDDIHGLNQGRARTHCVVSQSTASGNLFPAPCPRFLRAATEYVGCPFQHLQTRAEEG